MPVYSLAEIKALIAALDIKIGKAEDQQANTSGGPGQGQHLQRGDLGAMYRERERLCKEYERLEARENRGAISLVRFAREE